MQIKLTQSGYENFTGHFGNINFVDGLSEHVADQVAVTFKALLGSEPYVAKKEERSPVVTEQPAPTPEDLGEQDSQEEKTRAEKKADRKAEKKTAAAEAAAAATDAE